MAAARENDTELRCWPGPEAAALLLSADVGPLLIIDAEPKLSPRLVKVMLPGDVTDVCVDSISILTSAAMLDSGGSCWRWMSSEWRIRSSFCDDS